MPNIWTHIYFGEKALEKIGCSLDKKLDNYFRLGTQGPDPFFYHSFWPWKKSRVAEIGSAIHHEQCGPFLMHIIEEGRKLDDETRAYVLGFVTHHLLDRYTHPYIHYRAGDEGYKHQVLETHLDTLVLQKFRQMQTWRTPAYEQIFVGQTLNASIVNLLESATKQIFPTLYADMPTRFVEQSYRDMIQASKLFYDPSGMKKKLLGGIISPFSHSERTPDADLLNEAKAEWKHPAAPEESSTKSFLELMDEAFENAEYILPYIIEYWHTGDQAAYETIRESLGNYSYDTGKDCELGLRNYQYDPIV
ncbi:hypothetical protein EJF36_20170 [Bacillus sp. HMF5848]|uniref:zinc dependent phospholipase C family protein n=1 Tax=Bacillus sp. HMF5848 TaxID=2495421 RepID=UPI000F7B6B81|nr:zinc dependent phospholipase C family protein [Bacillus sp. HMF5848]RSK29010.1 hypothetical protein EJF36_20170 [Bacillus sp. HMF5848]